AEVAARPGVELVAGCEPNEQLRRTYLPSDIPHYDTAEALFDAHEVDVALVAGVYTRRGADSLLALQAGAHVLADKPLCTSLDELEEIAAAADQAGRHVSVVFEKRFYPPTLAARRLLADGVLGDLAMVASTGPHKLNQSSRPPWFLTRDGYGGIAGDLPVHDIDLVLALTGARAGTVHAYTGNARRTDHPDFDDHVAVLLQAGPVSATIEASWLSPQAADVHGHYRMRLTGSAGTAELDWAYNTLTVATHDRAPWQEPLPEPQRPAAYFFDAVLSGAEPEIGTAASLLATRVALLAQHSADHQGSPQRFGI